MDSPPVPVSDISSPVWPRRASRACASCRRDKIRCDGSRPCTGCTKKGFTAEQCIDGCEACRRARVRCEDGKPCSRCRDLNLECAEENITTARNDSPMASSRTPRTVTATERAKLACANCRRDNKKFKCDDQRPCGRCVARSEECIHIGRGPKLVKLRCEACRHDNKRCDDGRPCKNCVDGEKQCITMPRKGRGHGTRVKVACMSCRRDKIRCDGVRPCASCVRKGFECIERACKACTREGLGDECPHRNTQATVSDSPDDGPENTYRSAQASSSHSHYRSPHVQTMQLPPQPPQPHQPSGPGQPPPHAAYNLVHHSVPPPNTQYYYAPPHPASVSGPGQPPALPMIPQYVHEQRAAYYPVIDPNIDNPPSSGTNTYPARANRSA